jgi:hypothetical protein
MVLLPAALAAPVPVAEPGTLLGDWPAYVEPIAPGDYPRYEEEPAVDDVGADLLIRGWRYDPDLGIVESESELRSDVTAVVVVHPWGIDDGQGWSYPQAYAAYGYVFEGLYDDNQLYLAQVEDVVRPTLDTLRGRVPLIVYALPGSPDDIRTARYRAWDRTPGQSERDAAQVSLEAYLSSLTGSDWPTRIPVVAGFDAAPDDVVSYDDVGWDALRGELDAMGIRHILLMGWAADMCVVSTSAGYVDLAAAFDVFLVGDGTMAAWPLTASPPNGYVPVPTLDAILSASTVPGLSVTQASAIELLDRSPAGGPDWRGTPDSWTVLYDNWQARAADVRQRAPDWSSAAAPVVTASDIDAESVALNGLVDGRTNVLAVPEGVSLAFDLPAADLWIEVRYAPDREDQALLLDGALPVEVRDEGDGWRTGTWTGSGAFSLAFEAGDGSIDAVTVDGRAVSDAADTGHDTAIDTARDTALVEDTGFSSDSGHPEQGGNATNACGCGGGGPPGILGVGIALLAVRRR